MINLIFKDILDAYIIENFRRIQDFLNSQVFLMGDFKFKHNLDFIPKDIIQTAKTGTATVTFNYDRFDENYIDITTSGAVTVRFLAGSMRNDL